MKNDYGVLGACPGQNVSEDKHLLQALTQNRLCCVRSPLQRKLLPHEHERLLAPPDRFAGHKFFLQRCSTLDFVPSVQVWNRNCLSCASPYHPSVISIICRFDVTASLHHFFVPCLGLVFCSSPNNNCFGSCPDSIHPRWPSHNI